MRAPEALRPTASPVNTYSRPAQPQGADEVSQLAAALGKLNPALDRFAGVQSDEAQKRAEAAAQNKIGGMTFDEASEAVKSGQMTDMQNPWFRAAFMKQFGQRAALKAAERLGDAYTNGFDRDNGDVEKLITDHAKPIIDQYGNDRHFSSGFNSAFTTAAAKLRSTQADYKTGRVAGEVRQGVYEIGLGIIHEGINTGKSADQIVEGIRSTYAGNKQLLNVPYAEQDAEVYRMAETLTKGISTAKNPELQKQIVEKMLAAERTAPDGYPLGKLIEKREFASKATQLLDTADKELREFNRKRGFDSYMSWDEKSRKGLIGEAEKAALLEEHKANPGRFTDTHVAALLHHNDQVLEKHRVEAAKLEERQRARFLSETQRNNILTDAAALAAGGNLWAVEDRKYIDEHGNEKTLSADEQRKLTTQNFMRRSREVAASRKEDPVTTFKREVEWFGGNGEKNPVWEELLKRGHMQGTSASLSGNQPPQALASAFEMYQRMRVDNPRLLRSHLDDSALDFYEAMRFGIEGAGLDPMKAAINAQQINSDPTKYESPSWKTKFEDVEKAARKTNNTWFSSNNNTGELMPQIEQAAKYFVKLGASPEAALASAKERVLANYTHINGFMVRTNDRSIPSNFPKLAEDYIAEYATKYGEKEGVKAGDLTLRPVDNAAGQWRIVHKVNPALIVDQPEGIITMQSLKKWDDARIEEARKAAIAKNNDELPTKLYQNFLDLDREEEALKKSGLGGAFFAARMRSITERRAKLGTRPAAPPPPKSPVDPNFHGDAP